MYIGLKCLKLEKHYRCRWVARAQRHVCAVTKAERSVAGSLSLKSLEHVKSLSRWPEILNMASFEEGIDKYVQNVSSALWHDAKGLQKREDETECLGEDCRRTAACYRFLCSRYTDCLTCQSWSGNQTNVIDVCFVQFVHSSCKWKHCIFCIMKMIIL